MANPIDNSAFNDAYTLTKYNYGVTDNGYSFKDAALSAGVLAGGYSVYKGGTWAWQNRNDYAAGWQNIKNGYAQAKNLKGANLKETYLNNYRTNYISDLEKQYMAPKTLTAAEQAKLTPSQLAKYSREQAISAEYNTTRQLIKASKGLKGQDLLNKQNEINQSIRVAKLNITKGKATPGSVMAPTTKAGKAVQFVKGKTGITKATIGIESAAVTGNKAVRMLTKAPKGTPATMIIATALEAPTVYNAYKTLGAAKGTKQLGKSVVIAGAGVLGYAAGSAALGAAVGSVVPIAGTAVGAVVGFVGGMIGAWACDSLARKLLPDEVEIAAKKEAKEAVEDPEKMKEVLAKTESKAETENDPEKLEELQQAYDNITGQTAVVPVGTTETGTTSTQIVNTTGNVAKLKETFEKIQQQLATSWNFFNAEDLYNSLKPYEKPIYQISSPYGYIV